MKSEDYKLIPMSEITDEAREIAVAWMECEDKDWIGQKYKLASDIMNYAKKYHSQFSDQSTITDEEISTYFSNHFNGRMKETTMIVPAMSRGVAIEMVKHFLKLNKQLYENSDN